MDPFDKIYKNIGNIRKTVRKGGVGKPVPEEQRIRGPKTPSPIKSPLKDRRRSKTPPRQKSPDALNPTRKVLNPSQPHPQPQPIQQYGGFPYPWPIPIPMSNSPGHQHGYRYPTGPLIPVGPLHAIASLPPPPPPPRPIKGAAGIPPPPSRPAKRAAESSSFSIPPPPPPPPRAEKKASSPIPPPPAKRRAEEKGDSLGTRFRDIFE
ncbi:hypothetical protein CAEBREN_10135 [Caenorhabditis brenneri]|uniref:Uncharacterized protein n=1 Tax=Caenorhabditis brenneri TaxID=135651 RepID=G0P2I0_CAEBE|nr:hypothetical protein CAEBREN_10135 [Caenorhabditis brenneri]